MNDRNHKQKLTNTWMKPRGKRETKSNATVVFHPCYGNFLGMETECLLGFYEDLVPKFGKTFMSKYSSIVSYNKRFSVSGFPKF